MILHTARRIARVGIDGRAWVPAHAKLLLSQARDRRRDRFLTLTNEEHVSAAVGWLCRAQDSTNDGGVCGRYRLDKGWTSSYPETTGYIIPTLLNVAQNRRSPNLEARAERCVRFLLSVQLPSGAFPAAEINENTTEPSVFNTAQIITGLQSWYEQTKDRSALDAAARAADWLVSVQSEDGAWRSFVYMGLPTTYTAHASCWLAALGSLMGNEDYLSAAGKHLDWVLRRHDPTTGWFDEAGFSELEHNARTAVTHTIGYTLWGVLTTAKVLDRPDAFAAVRKAASGIAARLRQLGWLPGALDYRWHGVADFACLTGNAQLALLWLDLHLLDGEAEWVEAADRALDLVKRAQVLRTRDTSLHGGIPGSDPIWGAYLYNALPNWAAKFFVDALLVRRQIPKAR